MVNDLLYFLLTVQKKVSKEKYGPKDDFGASGILCLKCHKSQNYGTMPFFNGKNHSCLIQNLFMGNLYDNLTRQGI